MAWLDQDRIPFYNTTGNHTTYDHMSEAVFADVFRHLPRNGPADQMGLSYFIRRGDLLLVFVNTLWSGLGGEGYVETDWLKHTLTSHSDAKRKVVVGHHPAFAVNGFSGANSRQIAPECADEFWSILIENNVFAYLCSHILAFDVQGSCRHIANHQRRCGDRSSHAGGNRIFALCPGGDRHPRAALPGRRLQLRRSRAASMATNSAARPKARPKECVDKELDGFSSIHRNEQSVDPEMITWRIKGVADTCQRPQTLLAGSCDPGDLPVIWVGFTGREQGVTVTMAPQAGRSPHYWFGPKLACKRSVRFRTRDP